MLKHWQTHAEYQQFISEAVASLNTSQLKKLHSISDSWHKLTSMNLDPVGDFLAPFYCDSYHTTEFGNADSTVVYIMEKSAFPDWVKSHKELLETISEIS